MKYEYLKCKECEDDNEDNKEFIVIVDERGRVHLECAYCGSSHPIRAMVL